MQLGLTQVELNTRAKVKCVQALESGARVSPLYVTLEKLAKALRCKNSDLGGKRAAS